MLKQDSVTKHQVGSVITKLMQENNLDESSLAKACSISLASLSRIKNNPDSNPTISTLRPIAKFFNITIDQLLGFSPIEQKKSTIKKIAVISNSDVFHWLENRTTTLPISKWLAYDYKSSDSTFATFCKITSNSKLLTDSLIIVDPLQELLHDCLIYIYNKKIKHFFLRKISIDDQGKIFLKPIEEGFSDYIAFDDCSANITVIGVVLETRLQYLNYSQK